MFADCFQRPHRPSRRILRDNPGVHDGPMIMPVAPQTLPRPFWSKEADIAK